MWCIAECVVCGRCGQELVSLEPHTCPPGHALLPAPPSLATITLQSDPVVSHTTTPCFTQTVVSTNCVNTVRCWPLLVFSFLFGLMCRLSPGYHVTSFIDNQRIH